MLIGGEALAQDLYSDFTHYAQEDGLSQNTVMSMAQDSKGVMWFATWNGLNRFDGTRFSSHKVLWESPSGVANSRIDRIRTDRFDRIWGITNSLHVCLFDPRIEQFYRVPAEGEEGCNAPTRKICVLPDAVWILSEQGGAGRSAVASAVGSPQTRWFSTETLGQVREVVGDSRGGEWVLTDNGLFRFLPEDKQQYDTFFKAADGQRPNDFRTVVKADGCLYFGGGDGRVWRYNESTAHFDFLQLAGADSPVVALYRTAPGALLVVTARQGIYQCGFDQGRQQRFALPAKATDEVHGAYMDGAGEVWLEQHTPGRILHFDSRGGKWLTDEVPVEPTSTDRSRPAFHAHEDLHGTLWVHPYGGGFSYYDRRERKLKPFHNSIQGGDWRFSNKIHSAFSDRQGNLWLCTHSKGLEKITFRRQRFALLVPEPLPYESLSNEVRSLLEDSKGRIWAGLKDGLLRVYDRHRHALGYLTEQGTLSRHGEPLQGNVYAMTEDSHHNLWIATKGDGLVKAEPIGEGNSFRLTRYKHTEEDEYSLSDNDVYSVYEDVKRRIWVATYGGGINYLSVDSNGKERFIHARNRLKNYPIDLCYKARFVTGDRRGRLWIGTTMGALVTDVDFERPEELRFVHLHNEVNNPQSLSNNDVHWVLSTRSDTVYVATFGGGLNRLISLDAEGKARFCHYGLREGLASEEVLSLREDGDGNLWMSTENGLSRFTPATGGFVNFYDKEVAKHTRFSEAASERTSWGNMLFGTSNGICYFNPDSTRRSDFVPPIVLSGLRVEGRDVQPSPRTLLPVAPDDLGKLVLTHREKGFSLSFAALDYTEPRNIRYAYQLEGFDKAWNYVGTLHTATYTSLPKGEYLFKVRSTNADGVWTDNVRVLPVEILPSFWETPFACFLYVLIVLSIIVAAVYILFTIYRLKHEVVVEQQLTDMKLRFFTDISHELRTPLTLIAGPVEYVLRNEQLPEDARRQLEVVDRNTNRMLRLINQILDFRKIQNKKMKLLVQRIELVGFVRRLMENFQAVAEERGIDFQLETVLPEVYLWADADKLEKIIFNLLSNAFKYTPDGKQIRLSLQQDANHVFVAVKDQGIGIDESKKKSIFLRFENLVDRKLFQQSTGIGLSLVKELVEMHKAAIEVESQPGEGSCFTVSFQRGKEHFDSTVEFLQDDGAVALQTHADDVEVAVDGDKSTLLVVEDNAELRLFLRTVFEGEYLVTEAEQGEEGLKKALEQQPDLIISDVMMPVMDGIEMLKRLRTDLTTSHIPVILLTAKTSIESQIEGLEYGADAYVTKPFSATFLKARVKNLLAGRRLLQATLLNSLMPAGSPSSTQSGELTGESEAASSSSDLQAEEVEAQLSSHDRKFMDKLIALMEKNIDNGDLVVDDLVQEMAVSRSVFFKKLKTLTGLAPVEFIKEVRIHRAIELIDTGEYSMTQIAYMVGINDPRYFSKCFKAKMGMTPTEYRDRQKKI